jgi:O-antigen ligase
MIERLTLPMMARGAGLLAAAALLNLGIAAALTKRPSLIIVAVVGLAVLVAAAVGQAGPRLLVLAALGTTLLLPLPFIGPPIPGTGSVKIFPSDLMVMAAVGLSWVRGTRSGAPRTRRSFPNALVIPFGLLFVGILLGVLRGHERYGESLVGQPFRLLLYSAILGALVGISAESLYKGVVVVFYAGAVIEAAIGAIYLATGRSQTDQVELSTGGTRALALGTAIYLCGSLILALLNLDHDRAPGRRAVHLAVAGLSTFGIVIAQGRTNFLALGIIVPIIFVARRSIFGAIAAYAPLAAPLLAVAVIVLAIAVPTLGSTLYERIFKTSSNDVNVIWRKDAVNATLAGVSADPVRGLGFGRTVTFTSDNLQHQRFEYTITGDPHNSYVWLFAGGGLLAIVPFVLLCIAFVADTLRRLRKLEGAARTIATWALGFWFVFIVNAIAGPVISRSDFLLTIWTLMLIPAVVSTSGGVRERLGQWPGARVDPIRP